MLVAARWRPWAGGESRAGRRERPESRGALSQAEQALQGAAPARGFAGEGGGGSTGCKETRTLLVSPVLCGTGTASA